MGGGFWMQETNLGLFSNGHDGRSRLQGLELRRGGRLRDPAHARWASWASPSAPAPTRSIPTTSTRAEDLHATLCEARRLLADEPRGASRPTRGWPATTCKVTSDRVIEVLGGDGLAVSRIANGHWNAFGVDARAMASYEGRLRPQRLCPAAGQRSTTSASVEGSYTETGGGDGMDLAVSSRTSSRLSAFAGVAVGALYGPDHSWGPEALVGYRAVASETLGDTNARFVAGGDAFTLRADDISGSGPAAHLSLKGETAVAGHRLRFIRSSSSALPPTVITQLEGIFRVPVVEAYGMTEAAHQMASNPLTGARKPGTVGPSGGPEIRISDTSGQTVPIGSTGEIVIRGPNVMKEYENNPKANADAFYDGWFRTGDQGVMDEDGYVAITGRLKEIINRGGEKISPREVDEILMDHPAVHQCVTFAMPHDMLGEDVAAAIVLKQGAEATDKELRQFAAGRLADFKVPKKILILTEIPVGATGKLQRIGLAQKLGLG